MMAEENFLTLFIYIIKIVSRFKFIAIFLCNGTNDSLFNTVRTLYSLPKGYNTVGLKRTRL